MPPFFAFCLSIESLMRSVNICLLLFEITARIGKWTLRRLFFFHKTIPTYEIVEI